MSWDAQAQCVGYPPDLFIVTPIRRNAYPGVPQICDGCPVRAACLADGYFDTWAVRGGMIPRQREDLAMFLNEMTREAGG